MMRSFPSCLGVVPCAQLMELTANNINRTAIIRTRDIRLMFFPKES